MTIRLNKVTRDLNVSISTAVEFLQKKGFTVEENPNTKITEEQFDLLKKEFQSDKALKQQSERLGKTWQRAQAQEVQKPAQPKPAPEEPAPKVEEKKPAAPVEIKTVVPEASPPPFPLVSPLEFPLSSQEPPLPSSPQAWLLEPCAG